MKIFLWRLAACIGLFAFSTAGIWFLVAYKTIEPKPATTVAKAQASTVEGQRTSPVLGKTIPGLPEYCADKLISVSGCDGMTEITTDQGNTYQLVEIGNQCWFADNLKEVPTTDKGWHGFYDDADEETAPGEGMLYTWGAAMNGETEERAQGVCPMGWHIPSDCDFSMLEKQLPISILNFADTKIYPGTEIHRDYNKNYHSWLTRTEQILWSSTGKYNSPVARWLKYGKAPNYTHVRIAESSQNKSDKERMKGSASCLFD